VDKHGPQGGGTCGKMESYVDKGSCLGPHVEASKAVVIAHLHGQAILLGLVWLRRQPLPKRCCACKLPSMPGTAGGLRWNTGEHPRKWHSAGVDEGHSPPSPLPPPHTVDEGHRPPPPPPPSRRGAYQAVFAVLHLQSSSFEAPDILQLPLAPPVGVLLVQPGIYSLSNFHSSSHCLYDLSRSLFFIVVRVRGSIS